MAPGSEVDPALVRGSEVKRPVGGNARLLDAVGALPYADFDATLAWMLDQATQPAQPPIGLTFPSAKHAPGWCSNGRGSSHRSVAVCRAA